MSGEYDDREYRGKDPMSPEKKLLMNQQQFKGAI